MKRLSRIALWGVLIASVAAAPASAQVFNELMRGAVNSVGGDIFGCGDGQTACNLSYRMYSAADPTDINGRGLPADGIPSFRAKFQRYLSDTQTTANFPVAGGAGGGNEWYIVWDGITGGGTTDFAGWYGAQSQLVNFGEIGNSTSFNCLPVRAQEACFSALDERTRFNDTVRAGGGVISHDGGISPIPCPQLTLNGVNAIGFEWEQANNFTIGRADGVEDLAGSPLVGYDLYLLGNIAGTDADFASGAALVASIPSISTTSTSVLRSSLGVGSGLEGSSIYSAAIKMRYASGLDSQFFSCASAQTGVLATAPGETGDANAVVDVASVTTEVRGGPPAADQGINGGGGDLLFINLQKLGAPIVAGNIRYTFGFDVDGDGGDELTIRVKFKKRELRRFPNPVDAIRLSFNSGIGGNTQDFLKGKIGVQLDEGREILSLTIDPTALALALSPLTAQDVSAVLQGEAKLDGLRDPWVSLGPIFLGTSTGDLPDDDDSD